MCLKYKEFLFFYFRVWFFRKLFPLTLSSLFDGMDNPQPKDEIIKDLDF